jgi:hypothetical protein
MLTAEGILLLKGRPVSLVDVGYDDGPTILQKGLTMLKTTADRLPRNRNEVTASTRSNIQQKHIFDDSAIFYSKNCWLSPMPILCQRENNTTRLRFDMKL